MLFSSIPFLYYFFPAVLILYFAVPKPVKNVVLFLSSLVFYAWGEPKYVIIMLASIVVGYVAGLLIERFRGRVLSKVFLIIAIILCVLALVYFKYSDFFIDNFNKVTHLSIPLLRLALPIGISFYSFQIISYLVDVYRGDTVTQKNPIKLGAYVALFAQLIAGPIVRYSDISEQLNDRKHSFEQVFEGIKRFTIGLGKKILIANVLGELVDTFRNTEAKSVGFYWLYAIAFTLHLYFDFSGYSDMAIGIGKIFGFKFPENFNYPHISESITEFWRRWHMSLGSWFRDYVYIPLGGNRVSKIKWIRNILVVWLLTGFWHGADWTFIIWGLMFAVLLMLEKTPFGGFLKKCKPIAHIYVIFLIILSNVIFNANGVGQMASDFKSMFGGAGLVAWNAQTGYYLRSYAVVILMAMVGATPLPVKAVRALRSKMCGLANADRSAIIRKVGSETETEGENETGSVAKVGTVNKAGSAVWSIIEIVFILGLLIICSAFLVDGSFNPFLYFRF